MILVYPSGNNPMLIVCDSYTNKLITILPHALWRIDLNWKVNSFLGRQGVAHSRFICLFSDSNTFSRTLLPSKTPN